MLPVERAWLAKDRAFARYSQNLIVANFFFILLRFLFQRR